LDKRIEDALAQLPALQRQVLELSWKEGLSLVEIAAVLGTSVAAVKQRAHRAYCALRTRLGVNAFD
jgi:RNA polymerase sigma-70 factor (ECF subfamily)